MRKTHPWRSALVFNGTLYALGFVLGLYGMLAALPFYAFLGGLLWGRFGAYFWDSFDERRRAKREAAA